ncbi:MAG TPA: hypothetical protein VMZ52_03735 [Bryobacteraceae bacterium]|nr:hypothetical protein [Bryobacteraceae bacterium]
MKFIAVAIFTLCIALYLKGGLEGSYLLPLDHEAIRYASEPANDPVSALQRRLEKGEVKLDFDPQFGYVPAVLHLLNVPISSQVLVFSKTSFQSPRISPRSPRAIYFNDRVAVGSVRGGDVVELSALDPRQGIVFYTLDQEKSERVRFVRRYECLQCHHSSATLGVPGSVVRSVHTSTTGMPVFQAGTFVTDHRSPFAERWGGWYVSGTHGTALHMGNVTAEDKETGKLEVSHGANITDLKAKFDTGAYLSPHSDIVSLMVLEHQSRMTNLITRVGWEERMALHAQIGMNRILHEPEDAVSDSTRRRIHNASDELVRYLVFAEEAPLTAEVRGTSGFAAEFAKLGPRDAQGRSLRDFDLTRRMFKYPCSYLIYSEAFDAIPRIAREQIYRRLWEVLTGVDNSPAYANLSVADRKAILEILLETKKGLPAYWTPRG